jgi:hypothetical protein
MIYSIGLGFLIANNIVLYLTFLWAYFFNDYVFSTNINAFGEANFEFVILPISIILGVYACFSLFKQSLNNPHI